MENRRTLRIHLILEVTIPQHSSLFQALVLALWRFQGLAMTNLFSAVLQAIQDRAGAERSWRRLSPAGSGTRAFVSCRVAEMWFQ